MCLVSLVATLYSHVASPLQHIFSVRRRLRHPHSVHLHLCHFGNFHPRVLVWVTLWLMHQSVIQLVASYNGNSAGNTELRKEFLDCKRLSADLCPNSEWTLLDSGFFFSTRAHTFLRM